MRSFRNAAGRCWAVRVRTRNGASSASTAEAAERGFPNPNLQTGPNLRPFPEYDRKDLSMPQPVVKMEGFERKYLDIAGVETVVYTIGSGPPLVFLHGAGT